LLERHTGLILAVDQCAAYLADSVQQQYRSMHRPAAPLSFRSALAAIMAADRAPIVIDDRLTRLLPADDLKWCGTTHARALIPIVASGDSTIGFLAIGSKLSGDTLNRAERTFLGTVASAVGLRVEALAAVSTTTPQGDEPAAECALCRLVQLSGTTTCACGEPTRPAAVPYELAGKFQVVSYIGSGGMGVVYRATDTSLNRPVALKTIERLSVTAADRLASEARIMAAVAHPNLATIFGIERWRRTPVLVLEFLDGGTLADRKGGRWTVPEALRLGVLLAPALEQLHQSGVLHRDIKPSNIGFTRDHAPKLLDFGIASFLSERPERSHHAGQLRRPGTSETQAAIVAGRAVAGTPLYLPPEVLDGAVPSAAFDLWALALVMFEAIAGCHPFAAPTVEGVLQKLSSFESVDLARWCPGVSSNVAASFDLMLSRDPARRPSTAAAMRLMVTRLL
jgi:hypothetical protein